MSNAPSGQSRTLHPVILSGGIGTRLWPLSRANHPKQLQALVGKYTMLQDTALRLHDLPDVMPPTIICSNDHRFIIAEQLQSLGITPTAMVLEPVARNTAPAIAVAALRLRDQPDAILAVLPADHAIGDQAAFRTAIGHAVELARAGKLVTFGIQPRGPHTGYGYIERGAPIGDHGFAVKRFKEKPDAKTAATYIAAGTYLWNSGIFVFRADRFLAELSRFQPAIVAACEAAIATAKTDLDFLRLDSAAFALAPALSIDYAVMEHTDAAAIIPVEMGWSDVGAWDALWDIGKRNADGNVTIGDVVTRNVKNSYIRAESALVTVLGLNDVLVVQTSDAVLVAHRSQAEQVKDLVGMLDANGRSETKTHRRVHRPWGYYETTDLGDRFQVKRLVVKPGGTLSLQMHHHRAEHWVVVSGTAKVTRDDATELLAPNESTYIPIGMRHRLENPGKVLLELIEVQSGSYLGEDDIVRYDDVYKRET